jgi:hypothetical protein
MSFHAAFTKTAEREKEREDRENRTIATGAGAAVGGGAGYALGRKASTPKHTHAPVITAKNIKDKKLPIVMKKSTSYGKKPYIGAVAGLLTGGAGAYMAHKRLSKEAQ